MLSEENKMLKVISLAISKKGNETGNGMGNRLGNGKVIQYIKE